jgi:hypothetical protein
MRFAEIAARSLLAGVALPQLPFDEIPVHEVSANPNRLLIRQSDCAPGKDVCGDGCMPSGGVCCASLGRESYCDAGYYCMAVSGCCPVRISLSLSPESAISCQKT